MPSSPAELLQLSKDLLALNQAEVWQRCVVSRAYYASLHATDATFPRTAQTVRVDGESSHAEIIGRAVVYGRSIKPGRTNANLIAQALPRLRRFRNIADYRLDETLSAREYSDVVHRAERVLELCQDVARLRDASATSAEALSTTVPELCLPEGVEETDPPKGAAGSASAKPTLKRIK